MRVETGEWDQGCENKNNEENEARQRHVENKHIERKKKMTGDSKVGLKWWNSSV